MCQLRNVVLILLGIKSPISGHIVSCYQIRFINILFLLSLLQAELTQKYIFELTHLT